MSQQKQQKHLLKDIFTGIFTGHFVKFLLPQWSFLLQLLIGNVELFLLFQMFACEISWIFQTQKQLLSGAQQK